MDYDVRHLGAFHVTLRKYEENLKIYLVALWLVKWNENHSETCINCIY